MTDDNDPLEPTITGPGDDQPRGADDALPRIEGYDITGKVGQGGMGIVWRARVCTVLTSAPPSKRSVM